MNTSNNSLNNQNILAIKGSGYYSEKTAGVKIVIDSVQLLMEKDLSEIPELSTLRIADYGSTDGGTSQEMWSNLINIIRNKKYSRDIDEIINSFYSNYENEIAENPDGHAMDYIHVIMEIEKI